jgi:hypothetical protein
MNFDLNNIEEKDAPISPLSTGENCRSLTRYVLELFRKQQRLDDFEMDNSK